jgi:hypothetical protein
MKMKSSGKDGPLSREFLIKRPINYEKSEKPGKNLSRNFEEPVITTRISSE